MCEALHSFIKLAVDIRRKILADGGQMLSDCEAVLIEDGSHQEDIWGTNWIPETQTIEYEALINIRPNQQNFSLTIEDPSIKEQIKNICSQLLGEV